MSARKATWKTWAKRGLTAFFFCLVPVLLFMLVKNLDWQEVRQAIANYKATTLALAGLACAASYATYCCFDLVGRHYTAHKLPAWQTVPVTFVCYAFNLNLSSWVGGIALRYRLYSRLGLDVPTITKVLSLSLITNWLGYMLLAGCVFSLRLVDLPEGWKIGETGLQLIGFALVAAALAYLAACRFSKRRNWRFRDQELTLPSLRMALIQVGLGMLNWSLMAALIWILLPKEAFYPSILGILLISSIAGVITHIPAGLGVLEAVFIALMQHQMSKGTLLAALIGYRAIYFLLPLAIACVVYLVLERRAKQIRQRDWTHTSKPGTPEPGN
ncbi:lysylphosphatidylglycerol synthase domain-containing protein [Pseudomonas sp. No.21]|uniref:lysylphosphatidylglycerol synthase domain-containing protein n=1 Tax=Pseudomonas TaxID=286 RepID=UPI000DA7E9BC|nr:MULTISPECIES: lysylphosphatidylglycerol synthase domain-containing protein [Pseudomonas]MDW3716521.1 lysylphosphatidylglycerol synthase domain-containing protein [Pseudomonas sp. 2023EL-01195]PZE09830.1 UPF0104 family protein [Pseudomonas sp. 57B-090624]GJN45838.1 membrane protein [Pseudomonas tohonis]